MAVLKIRNAADNDWIDIGASAGNKIYDADQDTKVQCEESTDEDIIRMDAGGNEIWVGTADGYITKPLLPCFSVQLSAHQSNMATSPTTITFNTERIDRGSDFDTTTYTFTAPVTGVYQLQANMAWGDMPAAGIFYFYIVTSNRTYSTYFSDVRYDASGYMHLCVSVLADMDAADTAYCQQQQVGAAAVTDVQSVSFFSGYLVA
jgi:hypothetical protein